MVAPWVTLDAIPSPPDLPGTEEEVAAEWAAIIAQASEVLWALSGRRWFGTTTVTREVVAPSPGCDLPPGWDTSWGLAMHPVVVDGQITNRSCGCAPPPAVRLPGSPVEVTEVQVRGTVRDAATYRLRGAYLEDLTGRGWPTCDPGIVVEYLSGKPPPPGGVRAAALLAKELALARLGDPACGLPTNTTSVTRQGITQTFVSAADLIDRGQTGLVPVDSWVATVNPAKLTRRARAWSPDTSPRTYRRTAP